MSLLKITRPEFDKQFNKLLAFFKPKLTSEKDREKALAEIAQFKDIYFEACNDLTYGELCEGVQRCLREVKFMPKPAELRKQADADARPAYSSELEKVRRVAPSGSFTDEERRLASLAKPDCKYGCGGRGTLVVRLTRPEFPRRDGSAFDNAGMAARKVFGAIHTNDVPAGARFLRRLNEGTPFDAGSSGYSCPCTDEAPEVSVESLTSDPVDPLNPLDMVDALPDGGFTEADFA